MVSARKRLKGSRELAYRAAKAPTVKTQEGRDRNEKLGHDVSSVIGRSIRA
jgi:hypothetical protein